MGKHEAEFLNEIDIMKKLRHPNLVSLIGSICDERKMCMILEYLPGGNLNEFLVENREILKLETFPPILRQVALGMNALGKQGIIHRDLAARNVLIGLKLQIKVADFGLSRDTNDQDYYNFQSGGMLPIRWAAPDVFRSKKYTTASDVYSFGILISEVYTRGEIPFNDDSDDEFARFIVSDRPIIER